MRINQKGFSHVEVLMGLAVVGLIGVFSWYIVSANNDSNDTQASVGEQEEQETIDQLPDDVSTIKTIEEVRELAKTDSSEDIVGVELEAEDGVTLYVVHLSDGTVYAYDAFTGARVEYDDNHDDEDDEPLPADFEAKISIQQAIATANNKRPNSKVEKVEIEVESGVVVYSVRFTDDSRVDVNATTGAVVRVKDESGDDTMKSHDDDEHGGSRSSDPTQDDDDDSDRDERDDDREEDSDRDEDDDRRDNSGSGSN